MEQTVEVTAIERVLEIEASPETVWQFLVDPEKSLTWWGISAVVDLRPGGEYQVQVTPEHRARGEFVEIDPPRRLVYTFGWAEGEHASGTIPPGGSTVEIELAPSGAGTTLRFAHRDIPNAESAASHSRGWDHYLPRLAIAAAGGDPGPDPWQQSEQS